MTVCLTVVASWVILMGLVMGVLILMSGFGSGVFGVLTFMGAMGWMGGGASVGCLLLGVAWMIRRQHNADSVQRHVLSALTGRAGGDAAAPPGSSVVGMDSEGRSYPGDLSEVLWQLRELNANVLLTDEQREVKRRHRQWQVAERIAAEAEQQLSVANFAEAEQLLERLIAEVPDDPRYKELSERLTEARSRAEAGSIHSTMEN